MRRYICLLAAVLLLLSLSACGVGEVPEANTYPVTQATEPPTQAPTEAPTEPPTEPTTLPFVPEYDQNGAYRRPIERPYELMVSNPNKDIYDTPDGELVKMFGRLGYFTIVEEAVDADGFVWGRLENGEGWTMIHQERFPANKTLNFGSGVGAWGTTITIDSTGDFTGKFRDSDMGDVGNSYPNGTCYVCNFSGSFEIDGISDYYVSLSLTELSERYSEGAVWIDDGVRYIASGPYGLEGGSRFRLYIPDTPISALPEDARSWLPWDAPTSGRLGRFALYNMANGETFFS